jgi:imidazolonepropionase-like amidohydrolase
VSKAIDLTGVRAGCVLGALLLAAMTASSGALAADLVVRNARLIDGTGAPPRDAVSILIRDGVIREIGPTIGTPDGAAVIDAQGGTVIPGLIDAHVHLYSVPGAAFRGDSEEVKRERRRAHLRAYLANGVTSVLDTGISLEHLAEIRGWLAAGAPGPRVYALGPPLSAPGGYADDRPESYAFHFSVPDPAAAEAMVARVAAAGAVGIKVKIEYGFGPTEVWPIHSPEVRRAIVAAARRHGIPVYVHAFSEEEQRIAIEMEPHALVHGGFMRGAPSDEHVERLRSAGTWMISTLSIGDAGRLGLEPELLDAPHVRLSVPEDERNTARDPASGEALTAEVTRLSTPWWMPGWFLRVLVTAFPSLNAVATEPAAAAIGRFHAAGIPIVMGSDSGNWEIIPYEFHGPTSVREVELLANAGLTPAEAIVAATRLPAEMLGVADEIGSLQVGKRADLVILAEDPLEDLSALTRPLWIVKDGEARTPMGWMTD